MRPVFALVLALGSTTLCACPPVSLQVVNDAPKADLVINAPEEPVGQRLGWSQEGQATWLNGTLTLDDNSLLDELELNWSFELVPEGSELTDEAITPADPFGYATFVPDLEGTYRVALTATDRFDETSTPAVAVVVVTPPMELTATLEWDTNRVDLDLHLIAPDGSYFGDTDCFSWNPNPNWGDPALADDDPLLADDEDGEGVGPYFEQIGLRQPPQGQYRVLVHHYLDHGLALGQDARAALPTVSIEAGGEQLVDAMEAPAPLLEDDVWVVGVIEWPGTFAAINQMSDHASEL
jgi:hypothetical protein